MSVPPCPMCGHSRNASAKRGEVNLFICSVHGLYDNDPSEGGTHSTFNPGARMEREERRQDNRARDRFNRK